LSFAFILTFAFDLFTCFVCLFAFTFSLFGLIYFSFVPWGSSSNMAASPFVITVLLLGAGLIAVGVYIALLSRHRKAGTGELGLVGLIARVETTLEPDGAILVRGELWRARLRQAGSPVPNGRAVRIVGARGHFLEVEPTD
jgi:membrane-bound ClpP family serine protease